MKKNKNITLKREDSLDSFQINLKIYQKSKAPRQSKKITAKKQSENLKYIKMSRGASAPKAKFTIADIKQENYPDLSVETLKKAIKHFVSSRPEKMQKNKPDVKKMHIEYDNYGHLTPHEPYHRLNSTNMKELNSTIETIKENLEKIHISQNCNVENLGLSILSLYDNLSTNVLSKLSEDALSKCEFVGELFNFSWELISKLLCKILELLKFSDDRSKKILKESMDDMTLFSKKYDELAKKQPIVIEKEVFIESPSLINDRDQKLKAQKELEASINRTKEIQRKLNNEIKSKEAWKSASIDLCKLSSPSIIQLFDKQSEWSKLGQSYIDICHSKVKDIIEMSKDVTNRWNEECLEVYTLTYKAQSTLLVHLNSICSSCSEICRTLTDDYNLYHSGKVRQPEAYQKALTNGKLQKISENLIAWNFVVQQWMELEYSELINEARNITLNLDDEFINFMSLIENSIVKKHFSKESINDLRSLHQRMTTILKRITMPINDQTRSILKPIQSQFKDWGKLIADAVEGKPNRVLLSNGYIDPMSMKNFVNNLDEVADGLQKFTQRRIEEIQELQMSLPSFTTDITKICDSLTQHVSTSLENLQVMLDENVEVALAWSLLYGAGVQGPFSLQKNQLLRSNFEKTYRSQFEDWMNILKSDFDEVLHEKAFEQFELFLNDWFVTAKDCVLQKCQFYYNVQVQTDPISMEIKLSKSDDSMSSSAGLLPTVMRTDTDSEIENLSKIQLTDCETLFDLKPFVLNDHFIEPLKRMKHFAKKAFQIHSNANFMQPFMTAQSSVLTSLPHASQKSGTVSKKTAGKARPLAWLLSIIGELYDFRLQTVSKTRVGATSLFYNPSNMASCFVNFLRTKYGVKSKMSKFTNDFEATLFQYRNQDPAVFALYMFKSGHWSSYCFDFYLMCRSILPKTQNFNYNRFAELVFSTFGDMPTFSVLSALQLYKPKNKDELLNVLASSFSSILASRRNESLSLFNSNSTTFGANQETTQNNENINNNGSTNNGDGENENNGIQLVTLQSFIRLASSINPIGSIETYRKIGHSIISYNLNDESISKNKGKNKNKIKDQTQVVQTQQGLTFDQFEVALLYCSLFSQQNIALNVDPFATLPGIVFDEIKNAISDGEHRKALTQLSRLIVTMIREMPPSDFSVADIIKHELRVSQIVMRKEMADEISKSDLSDDISDNGDDENAGNDNNKNDISTATSNNNDDSTIANKNNDNFTAINSSDNDEPNTTNNNNNDNSNATSSNNNDDPSSTRNNNDNSAAENNSNSHKFAVHPPLESKEASGINRSMIRPPVRVSSQILPNDMKDDTNL